MNIITMVTLDQFVSDMDRNGFLNYYAKYHLADIRLEQMVDLAVLKFPHVNIKASTVMHA